MTGRLIASGMATLQELRTVYTLEDAFLMDEALSVRQYNEWCAAKGK